MPVDTSMFSFDYDNFENTIVSCEIDNKTNALVFKCNNGDEITTNLSDRLTIDSTLSSPYVATWADIPKAEVKIELTEPKICKCCGATIHDKICEYCGVEYNYKEV